MKRCRPTACRRRVAGEADDDALEGLDLLCAPHHDQRTAPGRPRGRPVSDTGHCQASAALCRFSASSPTGGIGSIPRLWLCAVGKRRSTAIRIAYARRANGFVRALYRLRPRAGRRGCPTPRPKSSSSSESTSSAHPRKWRSGSPSVHPSTAWSRVARRGRVAGHELLAAALRLLGRRAFSRNPSPCDESTPIPSVTRRPRANALKLGFRVPSNAEDQARLPAARKKCASSSEEPEEHIRCADAAARSPPPASGTPPASTRARRRSNPWVRPGSRTR